MAGSTTGRGFRAGRPAGVAALVGLATALGLGPSPASAAVGELTFESCLTTEEESGPGPVGSDACEESTNVVDFGGVDTGLDNPESIAVSPDGRSLYAVSRLDDAVMRFDRDPDTGELSFAFCFTGETQTELSGACGAIPSATSFGEDSGLDQPEAVTVAPDGKAVYATSRFDDAVVAFKRKKSGFISYVGCVSGDSDTGAGGTDACTTTPSATSEGGDSGFDDPKLKEVAISRDGESLYADSDFDDSVIRFKRDPATAELDYKGCITGEEESGPDGTGACKAIPKAAPSGADSGLEGPRWVELSRDERSLYVTSDGDHAIARFNRDPASGKLSWGECVTGETQSGPTGSDACKQIPTATSFGSGSGLQLPRSLAAARKQLYAMGSNDSSLATFKVKSSGALAFKRCLSADTQTGPTGTGACELIPSAAMFGQDTGLSQVRDIDLTPDGRTLYGAAQADSAVATFKRNLRSGKLSYIGCFSGDADLGATGNSACETGASAIAGGGDNSGLGGVETVQVSADDRSLYGGVEQDDAVALFSRAQLATRR